MFSVVMPVDRYSIHHLACKNYTPADTMVWPAVAFGIDGQTELGLTSYASKIGHFRDVVPSHSLGLVLKTMKQTQQKQACIRNKIYCNIKLTQKIQKPGELFTIAGRTYDTTSSLRQASQLRYDLFTNMVASGNRIVRTIRLFAGRISTIVYISIFPAFD